MSKRIPVELLVVDALTLVLVAIIFLLPESVFRIILGLPFALFFPGYALVAAVFPLQSGAGNILRFTLSVAVSFTLTAIAGIILNYTPLGINLFPMLYTLSAFTIAVSLVAWYRWLRVPPDERYVAPFNFWTILLRGGRLDSLLSVLVAVALIVALVVLVYSVWTPKTGERFTEFYILGAQGQASDYLLDLDEDGTGSVTLGIINREGQETDYIVVVREPGEADSEIARVSLQPEEVWEQKVELPVGAAGERKKMEFLLFKEDETEPYRSLHIHVDVKSRQ
jgi:uncharacterized membrane protein